MKSRKKLHRKVRIRKSSHFHWRSLLPFAFIAVVIIAVALYLGQNTLTLFGRAAKPARQSMSGKNSTAASCSELFYTMMTSIGKFNTDVTNFKNDFVEDTVKLMVSSDKPPTGYKYFFGDIAVSNMSLNDCRKVSFNDPVQCVKMRASCFLKEASRDGKDVDGGLAKISICPASAGVFTSNVCTAGGGVSCYNYGVNPKGIDLCGTRTESCKKANGQTGVRYVRVGNCESAGTKSCDYKCIRAFTSDPSDNEYTGACNSDDTCLTNPTPLPSRTPTPVLRSPTQASAQTTTVVQACKIAPQCNILADGDVRGLKGKVTALPAVNVAAEKTFLNANFPSANGVYSFTHKSGKKLTLSKYWTANGNLIERCLVKRGTANPEGICSNRSQ